MFESIRIYLFGFKEVFFMSRKCEVCNKSVISGSSASHSNRKTKRKWAPNIQNVKAVVSGTPKTIHVCTRCLRSGKVQRAI